MEYYTLHAKPEIPIFLDPNIEDSTPKSYDQYILNKKKKKRNKP